MTIAIYLFLIFANLFYGLRRFFMNKKNARTRDFSKILMFLSFVGLVILLGGYRNTSGFSHDLSNNEYGYNGVLSETSSMYEIGYTFLVMMGKLYGLDFYTWRIIIVVLCLSLIYYSIITWAPNPHLCISFFSMYLIVLCAEQLRNFIGFSILQVGLAIYIYSNYKHKKILYVITVLLASTVHIIFAIYLLFLLVNYLKKNRYLKWMPVLIFSFCGLIFINGNNIPGLSILLNIIGDNRYAVYLTQRTRFGFILEFLLHFLSLFVTYRSFKLDNSNNKMNYYLIYQFNLVLLIAFPLYMIQWSFYRIARNMLLINYFAITGCISYAPITKKKLYFWLVNILIIGIWIVIDLYITTPPEALLYPFFNDNIYFK